MLVNRESSSRLRLQKLLNGRDCVARMFVSYCLSNGPARIDDKLIRVMEPVGSIPWAHLFYGYGGNLFRNQDEEAGVGWRVSNSPHLIEVDEL